MNRFSPYQKSIAQSFKDDSEADDYVDKSLDNWINNTDMHTQEYSQTHIN